MPNNFILVFLKRFGGKMKVICSKDELIKGMQMVQPVVSNKVTLPVLSNFLFETEGNKVKLSATDLEIGINCYIKAEIQKEGAVTIPAKRFADIIKELPDGNIEIKSDDTNQINIKSAKSKFVLMGIDKKEYPSLPDFPKENTINLKAKVLADMFKKTIFAVSKDEQRYVLNGVYVVAEGGVLKAVSTDGRRLSHISLDGIDKKLSQKAIVPTKAVSDILRLLTLNDQIEDITIGLSDNQLAVQAGDITFLSNLIEGTFPNYEQVIPKKMTSKIKLKVADTISAVKQMALLTDNKLISEKSSSVKFSFENNKLYISANTAGLGSGETELDVEYSGAKFDINFNPTYIKEVLQNIDDDNVIFSYTTSQNPVVLVPEKNDKYINVVMPMR